jgi:hypothetical protein
MNHVASQEHAGGRGWGPGGAPVPGTGFARMGSMRFAFKTSPQNTTWRDMLAVWQEADH